MQVQNFSNFSLFISISIMWAQFSSVSRLSQTFSTYYGFKLISAFLGHEELKQILLLILRA